MQEVYKAGRYLFALAVIGFGVIQFVSGSFLAAFLPLNDLAFGKIFFLYLTSALLVVAGLLIWVPKYARLGAGVIAYLFLLFTLYPHFVHLISDIHNPAPWTGLAETLGFAAGGFILSGVIAEETLHPSRLNGFADSRVRVGRIMLAISLLIVAVQHFMYADFIATLVTAWIPLHVFWAYFVGVAFVLTAVSLLIHKKTGLAATLLGFMFLFWVLVLHGPRTAGKPDNEAEWTSLLVALGFGGIFLSLAGYEPKD